MPGLDQPLQAFAYARVDRVLEHPDFDEALAIECHCLANQVGLRAAQELGKAHLQRRPHTPPELRSGRNRPTETTEGVLDAPRDSGARICQRSIEVEQQSHEWYCDSSREEYLINLSKYLREPIAVR